MGYAKYTEEQVTQFIEEAKEMGIGPAMRSLGFPASYHTAKSFFIQRNIELPTSNSLAQMSANLGVFYKEREKLLAAQAIIDRAVEKLYQDNLIPDDINKLSNAIHKAIQTMNLIEGKSTAINESRTKDGTDLAIVDMLNEAKMRNEAIKSDIGSNLKVPDIQ